MKHLISSNQFTKEYLEELFGLIKDIKNDEKKYSKILDGKLVTTLFYEPSTRTRLSFEAAAQRLGAKIISTENAKEMSSAMKGESLKDTIRVTAGYADAIVIRHSDNDSAEVASSVSTVPIINAGSGSKEHPTQALLDMYTIKESKGNIDGIKVAVLGDLLYGRTVHSLIKLLALYNDVTIYGLSRETFKLPEEYINYLNDKNVKYVPCSSFEELPSDIDVLYHTRTQTERFVDKSGAKVEEFILNKEVLDRFSKQTIVMHPLPRNKEISEDVDSDERALYFKQAHNGMYTRMGILAKILGE